MSIRRKRPSQLVTTGLSPTLNVAVGPASTPEVGRHPPLFHPEHLFPLLRPNADDERARRRRSAGSDVEGWEWEEGASVDATMGSPVVVSTPVDGKVNAGMLAWGYGLVLSSTLCFVLGVWSIAVGPFVDTEGLLLLDMMAKDTHYKYLLVFLVPVTLYAVIINWWGLKIFRHA